jgi:TolB protein
MSLFRPLFPLPMRLLAFLALLAVPFASAQDRVVINESVEAELQKGIIPVTLVADDPSFGALVKFALSSHGAISVRSGSSVKVVISRTGLVATVSCDNARFPFSTNIEARNEDELALRAADAAVVGLGRRWQLKPLYAGTKVAFTSRYTGYQEIYVTNLALSKTTRLTNYRNTSIGPRWSADGTRVYFISSVRTGFPEILSSNGIGEARKVITDVRGALGAASSGPDGRIVFASSNKGSMDIFVAGPSGEAPRRIIATPDVDADPAWSPDGSRLALTSGPIGRPGIYLASSAGGGLTRVGTGYGYCTEPRWNPVVANQLVFTFQSGGRLGLAVIDLAAGTVTPVPVTSALDLSHAAWCADGRHVVATQATKTNSWLAVVDTVTGKVTRLTSAQLADCSEPDCWVRRN